MLVVVVTHLILLLYLILRDKGESIIIYLISLICLFGFSFETWLGQHDWLISDEYSYFYDYSYWVNDTRFIWGYVNKWFYEYDVWGYFFIKLFNIPFLIYSLSLLSRIFKTSPLKIIIFVPYLITLGISNFRDILILSATLSFILLLNKRAYFKTLASIFILYGTRLFALLVALFSVVIQRKRLFLLSTIIGVTIIYLVDFSAIKSLHNLTFYLTEGYQDRIADRFQQCADCSPLKAGLYGVGRNLLTPFPWSQIQRLFTLDYDYGTTFEILRSWSQISYWFVLIHICVKPKIYFRCFVDSGRLIKSLLVFALSICLVYGILHFGSSHQRIKLLTQLPIICFYLYEKGLYRNKQYRFKPR